MIIGTAIVAITLCSKSSPLYPFNDWNDANCYLTVGKSMLQGLVPYRDLFEQKGPLMYAIHAAAALISDTTFLGVYFIEILAAGFFLFYAFKIMRFCKENISVWAMPFTAAIIYSSWAFSHGDSAEELCLPFFALALYIGLVSVREQQALSWKQSLLIGATAACVLWIKFSLLGFYLGWICIPAIMLLKNRQGKQLLEMLLGIGTGVIIVTIPILIYFAANGALTDLWMVYFYDNIFLYSVATNGSKIWGFLVNLLLGAQNFAYYAPVGLIVILIGVWRMGRSNDKRELGLVLTSLLGMFILVYCGGRQYIYYSLGMLCFVPIGIAKIVLITDQLNTNYLHAKATPLVDKTKGLVACVLSAGLALAMSSNISLLQYKKSDLPQYQFAEIINETEDATLLNYDFLDGGFYTTTGIIPNCKYFARLNINLEEMMQTQDEYVAEGKADYVVTRSEELVSNNYVCIAEAKFGYEGNEEVYRLYALKSLIEKRG